LSAEKEGGAQLKRIILKAAAKKLEVDVRTEFMLQGGLSGGVMSTKERGGLMNRGLLHISFFKRVVKRRDEPTDNPLDTKKNGCL